MKAVEVRGFRGEVLVDVSVVALIVETLSTLEAWSQIQLSFKLGSKSKY